MTNELVNSTAERPIPTTITIGIDPYVAEVIRRSGIPPRSFIRLALARAVQREEEDQAASIAACRNCHQPVHDTVAHPGYWVHGNPNRSRGCRAATFMPGAEDYQCWDDSLSRSWQARPAGLVSEAPEDYDIDDAWAAA